MRLLASCAGNWIFRRSSAIHAQQFSTWVKVELYEKIIMSEDKNSSTIDVYGKNIVSIEWAISAVKTLEKSLRKSLPCGTPAYIL